jgi:tRNA A37 threonylcarbamoyltransferase TsaD
MGLSMNINKGNIGALLKSVAVQRDLKARTDRIAAAAGPGMVASVQAGRNRARASVITTTKGAREAEARDRRLTRALDAGRG